VELYLKWIANRGLLYSTGNSAPCYVAAWMGGEFGEEHCKLVKVGNNYVNNNLICLLQ